MEYLWHLGVMWCIYLILSQGFNVVFGLGRLFNLAHISFFALGAYAAALLSVDHGFGFLSSLGVGACIAILLACVVGAVSLRLATDYFAIGTLALSAVITALLINWRSLTRGVLGIPGIPRPEILGLTLDETHHFFALSAVMAFMLSAFQWMVLHGPFGRALRAMAQGEAAVQALGRNIAELRLLAFVCSSVYGSLAGALFAYYMSYIDPSSFTLGEMVLVLTIVVVGAPGSFWGVLGASALLVVIIPEGLRFVPLEPGVLGPLRQLMNAMLLFAVLYFARGRLFPRVRQI